MTFRAQMKAPCSVVQRADKLEKYNTCSCTSIESSCTDMLIYGPNRFIFFYLFSPYSTLQVIFQLLNTHLKQCCWRFYLCVCCVYTVRTAD